MATSREQAVAELRRSIDVLPERTRKAMLIGLGNNTVITGDEGSWHVYAGSYDGGGLIGGLKIYRDGSRIDDTDRTSGSYVAMEDKAALVAPYFINASGGMSEKPVGQEALIFITGQELTAANMLDLSNLLLGYAGQL